MGELAILSQIGEVILLSPKTDGLEMEYITDDVYIMQSTGLTDKNKKDIFCGDIVSIDRMIHKIRADDSLETKKVGSSVGEIQWKDGHGFLIKIIKSTGESFNPSLYFIDALTGGVESKQIKYCEIIGNIYQDEHLLSTK